MIQLGTSIKTERSLRGPQQSPRDSRNKINFYLDSFRINIYKRNYFLFLFFICTFSVCCAYVFGSPPLFIFSLTLLILTVPFSLLHTHTHLHAYEHANTRAHIHAHTHTRSQRYITIVFFWILGFFLLFSCVTFLNVTVHNPASMLTRSKEMASLWPTEHALRSSHRGLCQRHQAIKTKGMRTEKLNQETPRLSIQQNLGNRK